MLSIRGITLAVFVTIAWIVGFTALYNILLDFKNQWYWIVVATFYSVLINDIFTHIICSHNAIKIDPSRITYKVLLFLSSVDHAWAPVTGLCKLHENHHQYADQGNNDNLNWRLHWYNLCSVSPLTFLYVRPTAYPNLNELVESQSQIHKHILADSYTQFIENNRIFLTIVYWTILYLALPVFLFNVVLMGRFLFSGYMVLAAIGGHTRLPFGYRNFNTPDTSYNNLLFHYLALGLMPSMLQNNHHGGNQISHRWFEINTAGIVIKLLRPLLVSKHA